MFRLARRFVLALMITTVGCASVTAQAPRLAVPPVGDDVLAPDFTHGHRLMRVADVHGDKIVFTYEDDLWLVPSAGGQARRLTNDPGIEIYAKFSPDGSMIAFTAQYDGNLDVYVMPAEGGQPQRLTFHPAADRVLDWWPDGSSVLFRSARTRGMGGFGGDELYRVSLAGGLPEKLPVDRAGLTAVSPDGTRIAYNRITRETRTWKRHRGGTAQDIWMGSLAERVYKKIIDTDWTDNYPMWQGDAIYFTSDREDGTLNIYKYELKTGETTRLTRYDDYDVKYPSLGPNRIVYQYQEALHLLDLATLETREVNVVIPTDLYRMRPEFVGVAPSVGSFGLSPKSKRAVIEARGEIINLPVEHGEPINLTNSSGSREKNAAWSPDGRWIAFLSDKTGEEEIYLVDQKGGEWKQLTHDGYGFRTQLVWSPDSKYLIFSDKFMRLNLADAATGEITVIDEGEYDDAWERWGIQDYVWSPCSRWVAYAKMEESQCQGIFLYSLKDKLVSRVTSDQYADWSPSFSPDGKYLYFLSNRTFSPIMCMVDQNHAFLDMTRPYIVLLEADAQSPFAPKDSEEEVKEDKPAEDKPAAEETAAEDKQADDGEHEAPAAPEEKIEPAQPAEDQGTKIDLEGIEKRIIVADGVGAGQYFRLEATEQGFLFLKRAGNTFSKYDIASDRTGERFELHHYKPADKSAARVMNGICNYHLSADGKKMIYRSGSTYGVVNVGANANVGDGRLDLGAVRIKLDRTKEFMQMFGEAWRIQRDWFYDPNMHGVDWPAMYAKYARFVPYCGDRSDLNYLIGEMIAELNIGHTYVGGGDIKYDAKNVDIGLFGADFEVAPGANHYRIAHIVPNCSDDPGARSPLDEPGCPIKEGDYLIAIDGQTITTADNPYELLQHKRDRVITVTYNDKPTADGAKTHRMRTIGSERAIRYREWVENNRKYVEEKTGGQIGYVHIPDMSEGGLIEFAKVWYPNYYRKGFVIDARYNGGGFTGNMIIDRLERRLWGLTKPREGGLLREPERAFFGPFAVLINEDTGSNGEMFAEAIKLMNMAPLVGMRTWGGSIGIEPHQDLVDGGGVTPPQFGLYGIHGRWVIEGRGVEPHFEVQNMPGDVLLGKDAQLDKALELIMNRLQTHPDQLPAVPEYPNKARPLGS